MTYSIEVPIFATTVERKGTACVIHVEGELDVAEAPRLREVVSQVIDDAQPLVFNLDKMEFCDSAGISVFVMANKRNPGVVLIVPEKSRFDRVLEICGLDQVLTIQRHN